MFNASKIKHIMLIILNIILLVILLVLFFTIYNGYLNEITLQNYILSITENETEFSINRIVFYSSANTIDTDESSPWLFDSIYQYTDIALYINNNRKNGLYKNNTLKKLSIDNIQLNPAPTYGTGNLYFKPISNFANSSLPAQAINEKIEFGIRVDGNLDYSANAEIDASCVTPITLSYINTNIKQDFIISDTSSPLALNGSSLKRAGILLSTIETTLSLDITITNNSNETSKCNMIINIPLQNGNESIYDGYLVLDKQVDFKFYKI